VKTFVHKGTLPVTYIQALHQDVKRNHNGCKKKSNQLQEMKREELATGT
jgi:hypothetical protein